jgi:hypothetical protein
MKKAVAVLAVLAVMTVCSPSFAFFFDPVSTILDAASKAAVEEAKETPSPAFVKLVEVYNMMCERQIEPNQIKALWKAIGGTFDTIDDAGWTFKKLMSARKAEEDVLIAYCWNTQPTLDSRLLLATADEIADNIDQGYVLFAHLDEDKLSTQSDLVSDMAFQMAYPLLGYGTGNLTRALNRQMDYAIVITERNGDKAVARTSEGEKEMKFSELIEVCDYIMVFDSPTWQKRRQAMVQETQEKSELEAYMDQLEKEVKKK